VYNAFLGEYGEYKTFFHGHSYTGNALACAAACACLDVFAEEGTLEAIQPKISYLEKMLAQEIEPLPHVGEVRQLGLMVGIELVEDRASRTAYPMDSRMGAKVCADVRNRGVILRPLGDVVILMPPLAISKDEIDLLVSAAARSISEVCGA
ncbi:MAG: aminotransferase class III-fold pyridoxal phosphate-dependent enzyme, partial [Desulfomonilaceae bacterium]|nr:aminotransferase class III-fold pyridoxal phosphate-dependent enzyme [Desulfomonilaceae bacterium]